MNAEILLITEAGYPWAIGGVTSWVNDLVSGLPERKIAVLGIRFDRPAATPPASLLPSGVRFIDVRIDAPAQASAVVERVLEATAGMQPAVIHATTSGLAGLAGVAVSKVSGAPLLVTEHGIAWQGTGAAPARLRPPKPTALQPAIAPGAGDRIRTGGAVATGGLSGDDDHGRGGGHSVMLWDGEGRRVARTVYRNADRVTSVSHANTLLQRRLAPAGTPIEVIHNGVELPALPTNFAARTPRTVVFVGRLSPEKGVDRFIRLAALLGRDQPQLRFEVRGPESNDRAYAEGLRTLAARSGLGERLVFRGPASRARAFAGADLLIAPSRIEACPYVALEAMAAGVPVVTADVGDCAGIVAGAGMAVRGGAAAFARAAADLIEPSQYGAAATAGRARVGAWFTRERMLARYRRLYTDLERQRMRSHRSA